MTPPLEHDYIGLSQASPSADRKLQPVGERDAGELGSLKGTELRLGLPGSASPERKDGSVLTLGPTKGCYGAEPKRVFPDGPEKWGFSGKVGSEAESGKDGRLALFPSCENGGAGKDGGGGRAAVAGKADARGNKGQVRPAPGGGDRSPAPAAKAQVVGWPPIRSYRKNTMSTNPLKNTEDTDEKQAVGCLYVKVSMDGAPYLRKVDLNTYCNYKELSLALEKMFSCFTGQFGSHEMPRKDVHSESKLTKLPGSDYVLTYEDKDGDWMLVGDVPWKMFTESCKRLRIVKGSDAVGLAPRGTEKSKVPN